MEHYDSDASGRFWGRPRSTLGGSWGIRPQSLTSCFNSRISTYAFLYNAIHEVTNHETSLLNLYHLVSCIVHLLLYRINWISSSTLYLQYFHSSAQFRHLCVCVCSLNLCILGDLVRPIGLIILQDPAIIRGFAPNLQNCLAGRLELSSLPGLLKNIFTSKATQL